MSVSFAEEEEVEKEEEEVEEAEKERGEKNDLFLTICKQECLLTKKYYKRQFIMVIRKRLKKYFGLSS